MEHILNTQASSGQEGGGGGEGKGRGVGEHFKELEDVLRTSCWVPWVQCEEEVGLMKRASRRSSSTSVDTEALLGFNFMSEFTRYLSKFVELLVKLVRDYGCDVMANNNDGNTPLHLAALGGSLSTVCQLIDEFKCDPNTKGSKGRTPVHWAADKGHIDIVRKLVHDYGCDVMAKDNDGDTPLHYALRRVTTHNVHTD